MSSDDLFDAISHPLRIEILKELSKRPRRFAEIKRELKIESSGLLDFHLKKLDDLIMINKDGLYALTEKGFAALQAIETANKYGWQKRSFYLNLIAFILVNAYCLLTDLSHTIYYWMIVLPLTTAWIILYSFWTFVKRRIRLKNPK
ncbi:helix-turn-helix transcriptional regulator [Candidatus Bathyarchaeota archaeon]|nr:helix-turn-helix transcriptional regulator [Candidatus Bathyarchaeota archaeon]